MNKSDNEWKKELNDEQFRILRKKGTEAPFSGELLHNKADGMYTCGACGAALFDSETKYDSGSGWPSFWESVDPKAVRLEDDTQLGMTRTEVICATCSGHLGHVFNDGPKDQTGQRFCINSGALGFEAKDSKDN